MGDLILAGDIGGTKINLALFRRQEGRLVEVRGATISTVDTPSLESAIELFLGDDRAEFAAAAFGVAGPVRDGVADTTNIPWDVDARSLAGFLGIRRVGLVNDLVAMGWGVSALGHECFHVIQPGRPDPQGNGALIAAGTGLGESVLIAAGDAWRPQPSEGGHTSFSPQTPLEDALLAHLRGKFGGHVSVERVLSGPGLVNIYEFLRDNGHGEEFDWMAARMEVEEAPRVIVELALERRAPLCELALEMFVSIYGAEAGNLALTAMATGGVFIGGGLAVAILRALQQPAFLQGFLGKGRMRPLLEQMPVKVITEPRAPLFGAAFLAERLAQ